MIGVQVKPTMRREPKNFAKEASFDVGIVLRRRN
jgi:hypothetical protein